jgi:hypothetical protein
MEFSDTLSRGRPHSGVAYSADLEVNSKSMKNLKSIIGVLLAVLAGLTEGASPGNAPRLPVTGTRIVNVATEAELQTAMNNLQNGDTILLANGTYQLTSALYINNRQNITIRGFEGCTNVVLAGKGMDNADFGNVRFGVWSNGTNTTLAHLTLRDTYDNLIILNSGAQSPHLYCLKLLNAGSQFIKSNPTDVKTGLGVANGIVEYCWFEYTGTSPGDHGAGAGYFNGISAHAAQNWIVRGNLFKNLHNSDNAAYLWNPAVLFWRHSANTVTEQNTFVNVDRAIAYGLDNTTPYLDHAGGAIRNNFVWLASGFLSAKRTAGSDGSIIAWNSPGTQIDHNTIILNRNESYAVEFRFATTTSGTARNNLADAPIHLRDDAAAALSGNLLTASTGMFAHANAGDLHLLASATNVIDKAPALASVTNDIDGDPRPQGAGYDIGADEFDANAALVITNLTLTGTNCEVSFMTEGGHQYNVERANELPSLTWLAVAANVPGTGGVVRIRDTNALTAPKRFYRVTLLP